MELNGCNELEQRRGSCRGGNELCPALTWAFVDISHTIIGATAFDVQSPHGCGLLG